MNSILFWIVLALLFALSVAPPIVYLLVAYPSNRSELVGRIGRAIENYFRCFPDARITLVRAAGGGEAEVTAVYRPQFERFYNMHFGWKMFLWPLVLYALLTAFALLWTGATVASWVGAIAWTSPALPATAVLALAGAFVFTVYRHVAAAYRRDFSPADLLWSALRLVMAVPAAYAIAALFADALELPLAFLIGVFPIAEFVRLVRRLAIMKLSIGDSPDGQEESELQRAICGVDRRVAERFAGQDVTTVLQLAYSDPIKLMIRTNLEFSFVTDCISQALLWIYLKERVEKVRHILRGAQEAANLYEAITEGDRQEIAQSKAVLAKCAERLEMSQEELLWILGEVAEDPYVVFLHDLWSISSPAPIEEEEEEQDTDADNDG